MVCPALAAATCALKFDGVAFRSQPTGGGVGVGVGVGLGVGVGVVVGVGDGAATATSCSTVALPPAASVTVRRTYLVPTTLKVKSIVLPVPSGYCVPPGPPGPSSSQVYVQGAAAHTEAVPSKWVGLP